MAVSIEDIKRLRDATGVSMSACKSALEEVSGDFEQAIDYLRKKGAAKAAERAERSTAQGAIVTRVSGNKIAMVKLLCETDFVARSDEFVAVAEKLAEKLLNAEISVGDRDLTEVTDAGLKLGENVQIGEMAVVEAANVGDYVHSNKAIGVLVGLSGGDAALSRDIAMHAAATNPAVVSPDEVPIELLEREKSIWAEQLAAEGKPAEIVEKIMMGKERKFREENALLKQHFVKNPDVTVEDLLKGAGAEVIGFVRFAI